MRICEAKFAVLMLAEGDAFRLSAVHNAPQAFTEFLQRGPVRSPQNNFGRAVATTRPMPRPGRFLPTCWHYSVGLALGSLRQIQTILTSAPTSDYTLRGDEYAERKIRWNFLKGQGLKHSGSVLAQKVERE